MSFGAAVTTDAEAIEYGRAQMQEMIDRAIEAFEDGADLVGVLAAPGLPKQALTVPAGDVREIGFFDLSLPAKLRFVGRRHWVYRRRDDREIVYVLSWKKRLELQRMGAAKLVAFVDDPSKRS